MSVEDVRQEIIDFFAQPTAYRSILILITLLIVAYILSKFVAAGIIKIAQKVAVRADIESNEERFIRLRQVETYLSVTVAVVRAAFVAVVAYIGWSLISPMSNSGVAAIGASAFFIVFAGQTLGMLLRDVTNGAMMIIEQWFHVGDHIKIEPFIDASGVVERFTLRSTKIRRLSGEILWVHNQQIQAVHVTPGGVRTLAVDVFTKDKERAVKAINELMVTIPTGSTMLAAPLRMNAPEEWTQDLWRITIVGQTAPGREWLIENFLVNALKEIDDGVKDKSQRVFTYEPIARYADPVADRKFKRAVRVRREQTSSQK